jgi:translation initiation factor IF-3
MKYLQRLGLAAQPFRHALFSSRHANPRFPAILLRPYSASPSLSANWVINRKRVATDTTSEPTAFRPQRFSRPTNDEIEARFIQLVDAAGNIEAPVLKSQVLRSFQKSTHVLLELDPGQPGRHTVCKIMPLKELRDLEKAKERAARLAKLSAKTSVKQIELNWSIDSHDLSHRLKKLSSFIDKGRTVEIVLTRKRGKRIATAPEIQQLLDQINAAIEEANARQSKAMEGEPGKTLTMTVEKKE